MKKSLLALALLGTFTGMTYAQSNVTLYGVVDTGLIKETGTDVRMGSNVESRLGFRGVEDLGSGLKASFELEHRFNLNDGTGSDAYNFDDLAHSNKTPDWRGAANVGLKSDLWGAVRLGRVNDLSVETYRRIDRSTSMAWVPRCQKRPCIPNSSPIPSVTTARTGKAFLSAPPTLSGRTIMTISITS